MKGVSQIHLAPLAREMREEGMLYREIAAELGVSISAAQNWVTDPDRSKETERRARYAGECVECGKPTDGSRGPGMAPPLCQSCREWPDELIIAAMREWAEDHGSPPTCTDWRHAGPGHPAASSITRRRTSWNELLLRAGFPLACDRRPETQQQIEEMIREGYATREIAEHFGFTMANIHQRLRSRGLSIRALREGLA